MSKPYVSKVYYYFTYPLAMMGVAPYRCLPGCCSMLANEVYVLRNTITSSIHFKIV